MLKRYTSTLRWRQALPPLIHCELDCVGRFYLFGFPLPAGFCRVKLFLYLLILIAASCSNCTSQSQAISHCRLAAFHFDDASFMGQRFFI